MLGESYEIVRLLLQYALNSKPGINYSSYRYEYIYEVKKIIEIEAF